MDWSELSAAQPRLAGLGQRRVGIKQVTFIRYDDATGDQHVAIWPPVREFIRRGTSATSVGDPEPVADILVAGTGSA